MIPYHRKVAKGVGGKETVVLGATEFIVEGCHSRGQKANSVFPFSSGATDTV